MVKLSPDNSLKKEDPTTWDKQWPPTKNGGMVNYLGHTQPQWDLRLKCAKVFGSLYNVSETDLATSFDVFCFMNGHRNYDVKPPNHLMHTD